MCSTFKKYYPYLLLTLIVLVVTSCNCHKGGEPVPSSDNTNVSSDYDNTANLKTGESGNSEEEEGAGTIIGGDDNEDDDDGDNTIGGDNSGFPPTGNGSSGGGGH